MVIKKHRATFLAFAALVLLSPVVATAQSADALSSLPKSDVIAFADVRRLLTEVVPRLLLQDPETLLKLTTAVNEVKMKTGFNLLSIERIAAGLEFVGLTTRDIKKEQVGLVAIVQGDFDANPLIEFLKREGKGKQREETYGGKIIYSEPAPDPPAKKHDRETASVTLLNANTLVIGDLTQVRATIDAAAGTGRVDPELVRLATRDTSTLIGMAGTVPAALVQNLTTSAPANDPMAQAAVRIIANIKQVFGSMGATPADLNLGLGARLGSPEQAASVSDMLLGLRQHVTAMHPSQTERDLLNSIQITSQGDEVALKAVFPNKVVQDLIGSMMKKGQTPPPPQVVPGTTKPKPTSKARRGRRRRRG